MNSARKIKMRLPPPKPRNPVVVPAKQRKAGRHERSKSGERQAQERELRRALEDL